MLSLNLQSLLDDKDIFCQFTKTKIQPCDLDKLAKNCVMRGVYLMLINNIYYEYIKLILELLLCYF